MTSENIQNELDNWDKLLSAASHLQEIVKGTVLVGGTAASIYAAHRMSHDADHILHNLDEKFDTILEDLETLEDWKTAKIKKPVLILGALDGVETGIRQLIRKDPLEIEHVVVRGKEIVIPTQEEILRIKGALILSRNATRDYLDFAAMSDVLGDKRTINALKSFDKLYPQKNNSSSVLQLGIQLLRSEPQDMKKVDLNKFKGVKEKWRDKSILIFQCKKIASLIFINYVKNSDDIKYDFKKDFIADYENLKKKYYDAKYNQMRGIIIKLHDVKKSQNNKVQAILSDKPNFLMFFIKGKEWQKSIENVNKRILELDNRINKVKKFLSDKKDLEVLAIKKLRFENSLLAKQRDEQVQVEKRIMISMQDEASRINKEINERNKSAKYKI